MLDNATGKQRNVIVRPHGDGVTFIQLDDLKADQLSRARPRRVSRPRNLAGQFSGMGRAARGGGQGLCPPVAERHRRRPDRERSNAASPEASISRTNTRPTFRAWRSARPILGVGRHAAELERLGLVAEPEAAQPLRITPARARPSGGNRKWPSYARSVDGAPLNHDETGPDISKADFVWCMTAITWGWTVDETKARLMEESTKAQENGERYADLTARNAALAVERRRSQPRQQHRAAGYGQD